MIHRSDFYRAEREEAHAGIGSFPNDPQPVTCNVFERIRQMLGRVFLCFRRKP